VFQEQHRLDEWAAVHCPETRRKYHCALYDALASALLIVRLFEQNILQPADWQQLLWWSGISPQTDWELS
jgi:DNA polymerase-3 subunit epsilon